MGIEIIIKFIIAITFIAFALMAKYSYNDGWGSVKKYWLHLLILGVILLIIDILKYLL